MVNTLNTQRTKEADNSQGSCTDLKRQDIGLYLLGWSFFFFFWSTLFVPHPGALEVNGEVIEFTKY